MFQLSLNRTVTYSFAQALSISCAVISVSISALVAKNLSDVAVFSTLPYGVQFFTVFLSSYFFAKAMEKFGRKPVFLIGCIILFASGILGGLSIYLKLFWLNIVAHSFLGAALATFAYFRFAATDGLNDDQKPRAISMVVLGGIVAAFVAPLIVNNTRLMIENNSFAASYFSLSVLAIIVFIVISLMPSSKQFTPEVDDTHVHPVSHYTKHRLWVAIYASGFGYMLMAMLMMQSSLKLNEMNVEFVNISFVIQAHVLAMFIPSLFMGRLIKKWGVDPIIFMGYAVMLVSSLIAIFFQGYSAILIALIGIGLGWNMLYVGGSSLVAMLPGNALRFQGINESIVALLNAVGALTAGILYALIGWENSNWLALLLLIPGILLLVSSWSHKKKTDFSEPGAIH